MEYRGGTGLCVMKVRLVAHDLHKKSYAMLNGSEAHKVLWRAILNRDIMVN